MKNALGFLTLKPTRKEGKFQYYKNCNGEFRTRKYSDAWSLEYKKGDMFIFSGYYKTKKEALNTAQMVKG